MERRGFTLIELLGVIVIIGILVLITTPIIMNTIENSRKSSAIRSAEQVIRTATISYSTNDNFTTDKQDVLSLDLSGKKPESGYIQFDENEKVRFYMVYNGYCVVKRYDSELEAFKMDEVGICDWYTSSKTIRLETTDSVLTVDDLEPSNLLNYRIYGNSYQETRSGKNLFNINDIDNNMIVLSSNKRFINVDGLLTTQGRYGYYTSNVIPLDSNTTYTVSGQAIGDSFHIYYLQSNDEWKSWTYIGQREYAANSQISWTATTGDESYEYGLGIISANAYDSTHGIKDFQLEKGAVSTSYEPYGKSPSAEFPSEIKTLGTLISDSNDTNYGKYKIDINLRGKNLFGLNSAIISGAAMEDDTIVANANATNIDIYLKKGTYSIMFSRPNNAGVFLRKGQVSSGYFSNVFSGNVAKFTFTEDEYLRISYFGVGGKISNIMLVEGSYTKDTMPEYEPYSSKTYSIYLDEPLRCVGDVCDYIDYDDGVVVRKIKEIDSSGEKTIEESFEILSTPKNKKIDLPEIKTLDGTNNITVTGGNVSASKLDVVATKK